MNNKQLQAGGKAQGQHQFTMIALFGCLSLLLTLSFIPFSSADQYDDCKIYGNCKAPKTSITFNNNTLNVNNSQYWQGYTPATLNSTFIAPIFAASLSYTNTVVNGNTSAIVAGILNNFTAINANVSVSYVPYVGANRNVDLNTQGLATNGTVRFNSLNLVGSSLYTIYNTSTATDANVVLLSINSAGNMTNTGSSTVMTGRMLSANSTAVNSGFANILSFVSSGAGLSGVNSSFSNSGSSTQILSTMQSQDGTFVNTGSAVFASTFHSGRGARIISTGNSGVILGRTSGANTTINIGALSSFTQFQMSGSNNTIEHFSTLGGNSLSALTSGANSTISTVSSVHGGFFKLYSNNNNVNFKFGSGSSTNRGLISFAGIDTAGGHIINAGEYNYQFVMGNVSTTGRYAIVFGKNINVTGSRIFAVGLNNNTAYEISGNDIAYIGNLALGLNVTNPQTLLHVNGTSRFENNMTINNLVTLNLVTLPVCNSATNGSIGRNLTGFYGCAIGDGNWVRFGA